MKEISKKDLVNLIKESEQEVDEFAYNPKTDNPWKEYRERKKSGEVDTDLGRSGSSVKSYWYDQNKPKLDVKDKPPMDLFIYDVEGHKIIVTADSKEETQQMDPDFYEWAQDFSAKHGFKIVNNPESFDPKKKSRDTVRVHHDPLEVTKAKFGPKAERLRQSVGMNLASKEITNETVQTKISRFVIGNLRNVIGDNQDTVVSHIESIGLPPLKLPEQLVSWQKQGTNIYGERTNEVVNWGSENYEDYGGVEDLTKWFDYLNGGQGSIDTETIKRERTHRKRRYNPTTNKGQVKEGTLSLMSEVKVHGEASPDLSTFTWKVVVIYGVGRGTDVNDEKAGMKPMFKFTAEESSNVNPKLIEAIKSYTKKDGHGPAIIDDRNVKKAFLEAITKIQGDILKKDVTSVIMSIDTYVPGFENAITGEIEEPTIEPSKKVKTKKVVREGMDELIEDILKEIRRR